MDPGGRAQGPARGARGSPNGATSASGEPGRATHTSSQGSGLARAGTRPGAPAPSFAGLTLLGYSKPGRRHPGVRARSSAAACGREGAAPSLRSPRRLLRCGGRIGMRKLQGPRRLYGRLPDPHTVYHRQDVKKDPRFTSPHPTHPPARPLPVPRRRSCAEGACVCLRGRAPRVSWVPKVGWEHRPPSPLPNTFVKRLLGVGRGCPPPAPRTRRCAFRLVGSCG